MGKVQLVKYFSRSTKRSPNSKLFMQMDVVDFFSDEMRISMSVEVEFFLKSLFKYISFCVFRIAKKPYFAG